MSLWSQIEGGDLWCSFWELCDASHFQIIFESPEENTIKTGFFKISSQREGAERKKEGRGGE